VLIVAKNAKFLSSQIPADQSTVEIVGRREDKQEDADIKFFYL